MKNKIQTIEDVFALFGKHSQDVYLPYEPATSRIEKSVNALVLLSLVTKAYNEDWVPDMKNSSESKYAPYKYFGDGGVAFLVDCYDCGTHCPVGLLHKSRENCEDAVMKFKDLYNDFFMNHD